jgi:hypothetical protein
VHPNYDIRAHTTVGDILVLGVVDTRLERAVLVKMPLP